ncbi:hypothetical protein HJD18_11435 [Thermoleophilia bacterium SCSIO 60948]|nr:hypothetical protein HJD18_11435 [Thermoleophilia bacterium SCSIO 60948]
MARYVGTVPTDWEIERAYDYMVDFSSVEEWDPGAVRASVLEGAPGAGGTKFEVMFKIGGITQRLVYETLEAVRPEKIVLRATTPTFISLDTITFTRSDGRTIVTYDAEVSLRGPLKLADPLLAIGFKRTADKAAAGLRERLAS